MPRFTSIKLSVSMSPIVAAADARVRPCARALRCVLAFGLSLRASQVRAALLVWAALRRAACATRSCCPASPACVVR